jgi:hypothetical protein
MNWLSRRKGMLSVAVAALAVTPIMLSAVSQAETSPVPQAQTPPDYPPPDWIIQQNALSSLTNPNLSGHLSQPQAQDLFGNQRTYLVYQPGNGFDPSVTGAINTWPVSDESQLYDKLDLPTSQGLPANVNAVLFDIEDWNATPTVEQQHPIQYMARAAADVATYNHNTGRHVLLIAAPAPDLTTAVEPGYVDNTNFPTNYNGYLQLGLAGAAAKDATVLDIQGQQIQNNLSEFNKFVTAAAAQAREANPNITILVGLTTTPKAAITAQQLTEAYCDQRSLNGYWLNIAAGTANLTLPLLQQVLADNGNGCPSSG